MLALSWSYTGQQNYENSFALLMKRSKMLLPLLRQNRSVRLSQREGGMRVAEDPIDVFDRLFDGVFGLVIV